MQIIPELLRAYRTREPWCEGRLIITPQYCAGWLRQLENMMLAVPADIAKELPERARELIGYSIHPAFMGHVDGRHPGKLLRPHTT